MSVKSLFDSEPVYIIAALVGRQLLSLHATYSGLIWPDVPLREDPSAIKIQLLFTNKHKLKAMRKETFYHCLMFLLYFSKARVKGDIN